MGEVFEVGCPVFLVFKKKKGIIDRGQEDPNAAKQLQFPLICFYVLNAPIANDKSCCGMISGELRQTTLE